MVKRLFRKSLEEARRELAIPLRLARCPVSRLRVRRCARQIYSFVVLVLLLRNQFSSRTKYSASLSVPTWISHALLKRLVVRVIPASGQHEGQRAAEKTVLQGMNIHFNMISNMRQAGRRTRLMATASTN